MKPESETEEKPPYEKPWHGLLCGQLEPVRLYGHGICAHRKNVVQAEAVSQKRKIEKEGGWSGVGGMAPHRFISGRCGDLKRGRT